MVGTEVPQIGGVLEKRLQAVATEPIGLGNLLLRAAAPNIGVETAEQSEGNDLAGGPDRRARHVVSLLEIGLRAFEPSIAQSVSGESNL